MTPTDLAITLAVLPDRQRADGWVVADEVRARLVRLGFDVTTQQVAAWLRRMSSAESPWIERHAPRWPGQTVEYRVTRFGAGDIAARFPAVSITTPWLHTTTP